MKCGICGSEEGTAGCTQSWRHVKPAPLFTFVDGERYWKERSLAAERARDEAVAALRAEGKRDYDDMRRFQAKFIEADQARRAAEAALATERARALEEAVGFEGHPPGVCLEHDRFRLEGAGLIDTEGHFDRCTGCGQLPPHAGCKAICAACAPPTGACYCAGCQVAGKSSPPPAPAPQGKERCPACKGRGWVEDEDVRSGRAKCFNCHSTGRAPRAEEGTP